MSIKKFGVRIYFKNGTFATITVPNVFAVVDTIARQLAESEGANTYWQDPVGPMLIALNEVVMVAPHEYPDQKD